MVFSWFHRHILSWRKCNVCVMIPYSSLFSFNKFYVDSFLSGTTLFHTHLHGAQSNRRLKMLNWLSPDSLLPQQLHKDRGEDRREETAFCLFLSLSALLWRHGGRVGQVEALPWGQTGCASMCLCECEWVCAITLLNQGLSCARSLLKLSVLLWTLSFYRL